MPLKKKKLGVTLHAKHSKKKFLVLFGGYLIVVIIMATPGVLKSVGWVLQLQDPSHLNEYVYEKA